MFVKVWHEVNLLNGLSISKQHICDTYAIKHSPVTVYVGVLFVFAHVSTYMLSTYVQLHTFLVIFILHVFFVFFSCINIGVPLIYLLYIYSQCTVSIQSYCFSWRGWFNAAKQWVHLVIPIFLWKKCNACWALIWLQSVRVSVFLQFQMSKPDATAFRNNKCQH